MGYGNGYGETNGIDQILPFTQNFTAGGADTLRGFENNTVGPRGVILRSDQQITGPDGELYPADPANDVLTSIRQSMGGNAMVIGGVELIFPTPFLDEGMANSVRTSLFYDVGNVWDTEFDYDYYKQFNQPDTRFGRLLDYSDWKLYRSSAGLSVQWISPMGPMVFSFSKIIKEREGDDGRFFMFNIGQTF